MADLVCGPAGDEDLTGAADEPSRDQRAASLRRALGVEYDLTL